MRPGLRLHHLRQRPGGNAGDATAVSAPAFMTLRGSIRVPSKGSRRAPLKGSIGFRGLGFLV